MRGSAKTQNLVWLRFWAPSFTLVSRPYSLGVVFPGSQLDAHVLSEACSPGLGSRSPALLMPGVLSQPHLWGACSAPGACGSAPAENLRGNPVTSPGTSHSAPVPHLVSCPTNSSCFSDPDSNLNLFPQNKLLFFTGLPLPALQAGTSLQAETWVEHGVHFTCSFS